MNAIPAMTAMFAPWIGALLMFGGLFAKVSGHERAAALMSKTGFFIIGAAITAVVFVSVVERDISEILGMSVFAVCNAPRMLFGDGGDFEFTYLQLAAPAVFFVLALSAGTFCLAGNEPVRRH